MKNKTNMLLMCINGIAHEHRVALKRTKSHETHQNCIAWMHMVPVQGVQV